MDEQNNQEQSNQEVQENKADNEGSLKICLKQECWKKCLAMSLMAFLGGFLAVYFVADIFNHNRTMNCPYPKSHKLYINPVFNDDFFRPDFAEKQFRRMEREEAKMMKDFEKTAWSMVPMFANPVKIKAFFDKNNFKVVVDTKKFHNNDNRKIQYKIDGRKLTVFGQSEVKDKNYESDISFSQDLILPEKAQIDKIQVQEDDNKWILTVPVEMNI